METPPANQDSEATQSTQPSDAGDMQALLDQGRLCYQQGEYQEALSHLNAVYKHYQAENNRNLVAQVANDIGVVYTVMQRWQDAEKCLNEAHNLFTQLEDYSGEAQALGNIGSMFRARGNLKEAAANLQLSADRFHLVGDDERRAMTLRVLSMVRLSQFRFLQALAAYDAALACVATPSAWQKFLRRIISLPLRMLSG
jgi:tetratricopeptide (TPR) repeat protein